MQQVIKFSPNKSNAPSAGALRVLHAIEAPFDRAFGSVDNPWHNLGALSYFFFWIIAATGLYLFAFFDTSVIGAYHSVELITAQWYFGGVIRSLHRYASDAFAVTIVLHLVREFVHGRYANFRWFSWVSGVPLLWLAFSSGINGYWLVWDQLAQFIAVGTAEFLDWLPLFGGTMVRNFLTADSISDRFFSLLVFLHIGIPLLLLAGMWIHIQRISRARIKPSRALGWSTFGMLLIVSLVKPALSTPPANMAIEPGNLPLDWFYLAIYPLMYVWSPAKLWSLLGAITLLLLAIPLLLKKKREPVAVVTLSNCNGCGRCVADCPYSAVSMQPRSDGRHLLMEAVVTPDLCASCGICAGACPSSTPFRSIDQLITGIDMPQQPVGMLRNELEVALKKLQGDTKIIVFGCDYSSNVKALEAPDVVVFSLICAGQLPPAFVEYAIRNGADGVFVAGCRDGDCEFRLGSEWIKQRLAGEREPHLRRKNFPIERLRVCSIGSGDADLLLREFNAFRATLTQLAPESEEERAARAARAVRKAKKEHHD